MSRTIFIQNSTGIQASSESTVDPHAVPADKIGIMDVDGAFLAINDEAGVPKRFQIVQGVADGQPPLSAILEAARIKDVTFREYEEPVNQVTTITPVAGSVSSGEAILRLTRIEKGFEKYPRVAYSITVDEDDTATEVADKLRAAIEAAALKASGINGAHTHFVDASGTATLILTAQDAWNPDSPNSGQRFEQISFHTSLEGEGTEGWEIAATTPPTHGSGSFAQVRYYEQQAKGNDGFYYTEYRPQTPAYYSQSGITYDLVTILYENNADAAINKSFEIHEYVLAIRAGVADEDDIKVFFGVQEPAEEGGGD